MSDYLPPPSALDAAMMAPGLSEPERQFRDAFVREYLKDYNAISAALRMGFAGTYAADYAKKLMFEPYVQRKISEAEEADDYTKDPEAQKRQIFKMLKREATYSGAGSTHSARVAALSKLSSFLGMDAPTKTQSEVTLSGGVQFYLPHNGRDPLPEQPEGTTS